MADRLNEANPKSNVSDATRRDAYREALIARNALDAANGTYRSVLKKWKAEGVNTTALTNALKARKHDPDELILEERERMRMLAASGVMPRIQQELFAGVVIEEPTDKEALAMKISRAADDGYFAGRDGAAKTSNPFNPSTESELYVAWDGEWQSGSKVHGETAANGAAKAGGGETTTRKRGAAAPAGATNGTGAKRGRKSNAQKAAEAAAAAATQPEA